MVLNELGGRITTALASMASAALIDEKALDACLKDICAALLQADVNVRLVSALRSGVKRRANVDALASGLNRRRIVEKAVFDELCAMLDGGAGAAGAAAGEESDDDEDEAGGGGQPQRGGAAARRRAARPNAPASARDVSRLGNVSLRKGKPAVVMFVGLQGCGKTTTCTKFAWWHKKRGWRPALVCADTFRAGAFDQLKQNATKAQIPFYGSYGETDPAVIAEQGVDMFRREGRDLIIVDTSGRHKQEAALFEEMRQVRLFFLFSSWFFCSFFHLVFFASCAAVCMCWFCARPCLAPCAPRSPFPPHSKKPRARHSAALAIDDD